MSKKKTQKSETKPAPEKVIETPQSEDNHFDPVEFRESLKQEIKEEILAEIQPDQPKPVATKSLNIKHH